MGTSLYIAQRTGRCNLFNQSLSWMVFWGWQLVLFLALVTLPAGYTTSKEYAELEWYNRRTDRLGLGALRCAVFRHDCEAES